VFLPLAEIRVDCPMTAYQRAYYGQIWEWNRGREGAQVPEGSHLGLPSPVPPFGAVEDIQAMHKETLGLIEEPESFAEECASGKMVTISKLISELVPNNHRVLIFSQSRRMLDMIQLILAYRRCR
jgi:SNF2 family DNA or RNA helicase